LRFGLRDVIYETILAGWGNNFISEETLRINV
jgi:hypothetical protein